MKRFHFHHYSPLKVNVFSLKVTSFLASLNPFLLNLNTSPSVVPHVMDQTTGFANKDIWSASGQIVSCTEHCHILLSVVGLKKYLECQNVKQIKFFMCSIILQKIVFWVLDQWILKILTVQSLCLPKNY